MLRWLVLVLVQTVCVCQPFRNSGSSEVDLSSDQHTHVALKHSYAEVMKDGSRLGIFLAAALGTLMLMAIIYCIYHRFYTRSLYAHTQLLDSDISLDVSSSSSSVFSGYVPDRWMMRGGSVIVGGSYGSLSDTPSVITLPPPLSPPHRPSRSLALGRTPPLRTISAQDLEKSFL